jgi:tetratricopeptide (TPR) repeat protein
MRNKFFRMTLEKSLRRRGRCRAGQDIRRERRRSAYVTPTTELWRPWRACCSVSCAHPVRPWRQIPRTSVWRRPNSPDRSGVASNSDPLGTLWDVIQAGKYLRGTEPELALQEHRRAVDQASDPFSKTRALNALAATLRSLGDPTKALVQLRESVRINGDRVYNHAAYTCAVAALADLGEFEKARKVGEDSLEYVRDCPKLLRAMGRVYYRLGDMDAAEECFDDAARLDPVTA